jgi:hypothetical protein
MSDDRGRLASSRGSRHACDMLYSHDAVECLVPAMFSTAQSATASLSSSCLLRQALSDFQCELEHFKSRFTAGSSRTDHTLDSMAVADRHKGRLIFIPGLHQIRYALARICSLLHVRTTLNLVFEPVRNESDHQR